MKILAYVLGCMFLLDVVFLCLNVHWIRGLLREYAPKLAERRWLVVIGTVEFALGNYFIWLAVNQA